MAPFILFQTNATFNCTFEDFNELKNLPMCKEMMMMKSIPQVLNWDDNTNAQKILQEKIEQKPGDICDPNTKTAVDFFHCLFEVLESVNDEIQGCFSVPNLASGEFSGKSKGLAMAILFFIKVSIYKSLKYEYDY